MLFTVDTGKAYQIKDIIPGRFYYPRDPGKAYNAYNCGVANSVITQDGLLGETSDSPRPLKEGEIGEWILLDGVSPSTQVSPASSS